MRYNISTVKDRRKPKREVNRRGKLKADWNGKIKTAERQRRLL
jgi:hypothetical protein